MQRTKRGNPHRLPKSCKQGQPEPSPIRQQRAPSTVAQPVEPMEHARFTLYDSDSITGNEDTLYTLFYDFYRGYTIYNIQEGRCIHGKQGCLQLQGKFICFPDIKEEGQEGSVSFEVHNGTVLENQD
jgi:hypothetical protein